MLELACVDANGLGICCSCVHIKIKVNKLVSLVENFIITANITVEKARRTFIGHFPLKKDLFLDKEQVEAPKQGVKICDNLVIVKNEFRP